MNSTAVTGGEVRGGDEATRAVRSASAIAGVGLLVMIVPALFGTLVVVDGLVTPGDATATATAIQDNSLTVRLGIAGLLAVAVLDVVVAWALYTVFEPVDRRVSRLAMLFRVVYAGVFVVAIARLAGVIGALIADGALSTFTVEQLHTRAILGVDAFTHVWNAGLLVFAAHLLLLGYLAYRADYVPTLLGILLAIAGLGYAVDSLGLFLVAGYALQVALVTFVGEIVLIGWLLLRGRHLTLPSDADPAATRQGGS